MLFYKSQQKFFIVFVLILSLMLIKFNSGWYTFLEGRIFWAHILHSRRGTWGDFFFIWMCMCPCICRCMCIYSYFLGISCSHCRQHVPVSFQPIMNNFALIILRRKKKIANIFLWPLKLVFQGITYHEIPK